MNTLKQKIREEFDKWSDDETSSKEFIDRLAELFTSQKNHSLQEQKKQIRKLKKNIPGTPDYHRGYEIINERKQYNQALDDVLELLK